MKTYADKMRCKHALFTINVVNQSATALQRVPDTDDKISRSKSFQQSC